MNLMIKRKYFVCYTYGKSIGNIELTFKYKWYKKFSFDSIQIKNFIKNECKLNDETEISIVSITRVD